MECVIVRYGEISLKGGNRSDFEQALVRNIKSVLGPWPEVKIHRLGGRIELTLGGSTPVAAVMEAVGRVFGVFSLSHAVQVPAEFEAIGKLGVSLIEQHLEQKSKDGQPPRSFKVEARRADKRFPLSSPEINVELGAKILNEVRDVHVDVHQPDVTLYVDVRGEGAYLYVNKVPAVGGMPVGSAGRVGLLLSGGIDSPVAGWMSLKRGVELEAIHFHSFPFTSERALQKVEELAQQLANWGGRVRLHVVSFTEVQSQIRKHCPEELSVTVMRRMMLRIATQLAASRQWHALVTGESLGQVASQTLESMEVINAVTCLPVLRPLISEDKVDIIKVARRIGTYETSILPYEDCCTIFLPKRPRTRPTLRETEAAEMELDVDGLVNAAISGTTMKTFHAHEHKDLGTLGQS